MNTKRLDSTCTGISVEDDLIRIAVVGIDGDVISVVHVAQIPIPKIQPAMESQAEEEEEENQFAAVEAPGIEAVRTEAVRNFMDGHVVGKTTLCVGLGEPFVRLILLPKLAKAGRKDVLKKIAAETDQTQALKFLRNAIDYRFIGKDRMLAVVRLETSPLLDVFALPKGIRKQPTRMEFVTSNELALINLVRVHFRFTPAEIVHVIHVERDKTRLMIMQGGELKAIVPSIQQGSDNTFNATILHDRIELAAEGAGYKKANSVVLSGAAEDVGLRKEILENNPDIVFHSLNRLRISYDESIAETERMADYTIPISLAWQKLQPDNPRFYRLNVLPHNIRERQRKFKLAWHGILLLLALFAVTTFLTVRILENGRKLGEVTQKLQAEQKQVASQKVIVDSIYMVEGQSTSIINSTNLLDTLLYDVEQWSQIIDTLATGTGSPQSSWISELKPDKAGGIQIVGFALERPTIPAFFGVCGTGGDCVRSRCN